MMRDTSSNLQIVQAMAPAVRNTDTNTLNIDRQGYGSLTIVVAYGVAGDALNASNKIEARLFDSDDGSTFSLVPDSAIIGTSLVADAAMFARADAPSKANMVYRFGYRGIRRYVRVLIDYVGTHTAGTPCAVHAILGHPANAPVAG